MNRSAPILLCALLGACDVHSSSGDGKNVTINADASGNIAFNVPFVKGQLKVPAGVMHNGDFDIDGVKLMPGSKMTGFNLDAHDKNATVEMAFTAPAAPDEVRAYFLDQFKQKGVEAAPAGDAISGKSKDGAPFVIHVTPNGTGSNGTIEIHDRD
ncbi:MAG: hypothetical protein ACM3ZV_05940 [Bacillota bacterium]